jgi:hypothetical protein
VREWAIVEEVAKRVSREATRCQAGDTRDAMRG